MIEAYDLLTSAWDEYHREGGRKGERRPVGASRCSWANFGPVRRSL
jgi:hypothetical protein